nr:MAG TPA: hypothetical protein [Caudoviricetes sp.]
MYLPTLFIKFKMVNFHLLPYLQILQKYFFEFYFILLILVI